MACTTSVTIEMESPPTSGSTTPATPATPYPLYRRAPPQTRHQGPLRANSQPNLAPLRPTTGPAIMVNSGRQEPNYPTRPVFVEDHVSRSEQGAVIRVKPPPLRATKSQGNFSSLSALTSGRCCCDCHVPESPSRSRQEKRRQTDEETTSEDLSWRRLHMSRAKLKATATTSELLSGFAMVAMVELQINSPTNVPEWLFVMFSVCTTVLVAVHIFALMISTYLLPNIDAVSKLHVRGLVAESPHERMRGFIELAWAFSTVLGLFLFLVEVAILCWVKFWDYSFTAAWAATIIVVPVLVVFIAFAVHFYHNLVVYKVKAAVTDMKQLEELKLKLDNATMLSTSPA